MAEVKSLFGQPIPNQTVVEAVVVALENLVERAKRGDVRGFAMTYIDNDGVSCDRVVVGEAKCVQIAGAIAGMQFEFNLQWHEGYSEITDGHDGGLTA